jgi:hypothetical protein
MITVNLLASGVPIRKGGVCIASIGLLSLKLAKNLQICQPMKGKRD